MTPAQIHAIEIRTGEAEAGPWEAFNHGLNRAVEIFSNRGNIADIYSDEKTNERAMKTADFIACARVDVPALCREVWALRELVRKTGNLAYINAAKYLEKAEDGDALAERLLAEHDRDSKLSHFIESHTRKSHEDEG